MEHWIIAFLGLIIVTLERLASDKDGRFDRKDIIYTVISIFSVIVLLMVFVNADFIMYLDEKVDYFALKKDDVDWSLKALSLMIGLLNYSIIKILKKKGKRLEDDK